MSVFVRNSDDSYMWCSYGWWWCDASHLLRWGPISRYHSRHDAFPFTCFIVMGSTYGSASIGRVLRGWERRCPMKLQGEKESADRGRPIWSILAAPLIEHTQNLRWCQEPYRCVCSSYEVSLPLLIIIHYLSNTCFLIPNQLLLHIKHTKCMYIHGSIYILQIRRMQVDNVQMARNAGWN